MHHSVLESLGEGGDGTTKVRTDNESWFFNDAVALESSAIDDLVARLKASRARQAEIALSFPVTDWNRRSANVFRFGPSWEWAAFARVDHEQDVPAHLGAGNAVLGAALFSPRD
jgi:hypothetical protein